MPVNQTKEFFFHPKRLNLLILNEESAKFEPVSILLL